MKLVMTLLVRDEEDIIKENIEFHLNQGVDFIIATDNKSVDSTKEILMEYKTHGVLRYIHEGEDNYSQSKWVTRMAHMAHNKYGADWVINSDADEFWYPAGSNLKEVFSQVPPEYNMLKAQRSDFIVPSEIPPDKKFFQYMIYRKKISLSTIGKPLPLKVAHRGSDSIVVHQGNHKVSKIPMQNIIKNRIEILHFPVRTYGQFENKIVKGGAAYARNTEVPQYTGKTWRELYKSFLADGNLMDFYTNSIYDSDRLQSEIMNGNVIKDTRLDGFFSNLSANIPS